MSEGRPVVTAGAAKRHRFERRLFSTLLAVLLLPSAFFIGVSYVQLNQVLVTINKPMESKAAELLASTAADGKIDIAAVFLERDVMAYRHQRTTALLATRTWMRFMSLIFGALLVVIGCSFVLGRVSGPVYEGEVSVSEVSGNLKSSSPGLFLIAAGIVLVAIPNLSTQMIQTDDASSYFTPAIGGDRGAGSPTQSEVDQVMIKYGLKPSGK